MTIAAGTLDRLATVQSPPTTQDTAGQPTGAWTTVGTRWVSSPVQTRAAERFQAHQTQGIVVSEVRMRHYAALSIAWRLVISGTTYRVLARWHTPERERETVVMVEEITS